MANVYLVDLSKSSSSAMAPLLAKNEDKDLQRLLENNFDLLPGDQIAPESPSRWLLVKREMPVPHPDTGLNHWAIDFLFADQDATPTFVECKRYLGTKSRREIVGQILEYAANAQHYWSAQVLRTHAETTAKRRGVTLEQAFGALQSEAVDSVETYFDEIERRLKAADVRIVFFLEQAPTELKRLVEFMNAQMTTVEVLLVEARQYEGGGVRIVVPTLFGFTEKIREIKRVSVATAAAEAKPIAASWDDFLANARTKKMEQTTIDAMRQVYDASTALHATIVWGRGTATASLSPRWPALSTKASPFSVYSNGRLELHFPALQSSELAIELMSRFQANLEGSGFVLPTDEGPPRRASAHDSRGARRDPPRRTWKTAPRRAPPPGAHRSPR